jgi:hypothetical protein
MISFRFACKKTESHTKHLNGVQIVDKTCLIQTGLENNPKNSSSRTVFRSQDKHDDLLVLNQTVVTKIEEAENVKQFYLTRLNMSNICTFASSIPRLRILVLDNCESIPSDLSQFRKLKILVVTKSKFSGNELSKLPSKIKIVRIVSCGIERIQIMSNLKNLKILDLSINNISQIDLSKTNLVGLCLENNSIDDLNNIKFPSRPIEDLFMAHNPVSNPLNYSAFHESMSNIMDNIIDNAVSNSSETYVSTCSVCTDMMYGPRIMLECKHMFDFDCIVDWEKSCRHRSTIFTCPICVRKIDEYEWLKIVANYTNKYSNYCRSREPDTSDNIGKYHRSYIYQSAYLHRGSSIFYYDSDFS